MRYKLKPLQWSNCAGDGSWLEAKVSIGYYIIHAKASNDKVFYYLEYYFTEYYDEDVVECDSLQECKDWCWNDWQRRAKKALDPILYDIQPEDLK